MKSYLDLIPKSARVHRKQNRLTLICIVLAVFLVTVIFSITDVWISSEKEVMIKKHGNYHIILTGVEVQTAENIGSRSEVSSTAWHDCINYNTGDDYYINGAMTVIHGAEQSYISDIRKFPVEGEYPQNDSEVMLSSALNDGSLNLGDSVTINTPSGDFAYTVSGFCDDSAETQDRHGTIYAYVDMTAFEGLCYANNIEYSPEYYIQFNEKTKVKQAVTNIKTQYGLSDENVKENMAVLGLSGQSMKRQMTGMYPMAAALFIFVLIAGVLMISSCMNSNVAQRTKFFGMMRCIGASKKQIIRFVRMEALNWCKTAIPIGCGIGVAVTWLLCKILRYLVGGEFTDFQFKFSIIGVVLGVAVGLISVLIAAHSPAKRAARVSPVAAVSGNSEEIKGVSHAANTRIFKVETALGVNHATSSKKNLVLMAMSFAFTILLFFSFFAALDFVHALMPSSTDFTPDLEVISVNTANDIDRNVKAQMEQIDGVEKVFSNSFSLETPAEINGNEAIVDLISYDDNLLGSSVTDTISGNISGVYGNSQYALTAFNEGSSLDVGDKVKFGNDEVEIAAVCSTSIMGGSNPLVYVSEETYTRLTGEDNYIMLNVMLDKNATEETVNEVKLLAGDNEFMDRREENQTNNSSYWVFHIAAYAFLAIVALITIFNIMNSISMSVSARIKQYGAMRAVGMSIKQLTKMITAEAVTYAVCGLIVGCVSGLCMHYLITKKLIIDHFGGAWGIPVNTIVIILAILVLAVIAAIHAPSKRIRNLSITDTIQAQ